MEKDSKTTVAVERTTFTKLDRLAKANNVSKMEFLTHAINYFEKYGINPVEHESPAQEMQKLIKRMDQVFAFLKKQMGYANAKNIPFVALVGENEMNENKVTLKNMETGEQTLVSAEELIQTLKK